MAMNARSSDLRICSDCATSKRLKVLHPCPSHPEGEGTIKANDALLRDAFLYASTLPENAIRLLLIEKGSDEDEMRVSLAVKPLYDNLSFNALSYTWGDQNAKITISCDSEPLEVGQNLYDALMQLRRDGQGRPLWVDAVCINQANMEEKTAQVQMMRMIYEEAQLVISWLGTEEETDKEGFALMQRIHDSVERPRLIEFEIANSASAEELGLPDIQHPDWKSLCKVLMRPYFFRAWIVQELLVARTCLIQCGTNIIDRDIFLAAGKALTRYTNLGESVAHNMPLKEIPVSDTLSGQDLIQYLTTTLTSDSPDPRTKNWESFTIGELWRLKALMDAIQLPNMLALLTSTKMFKASVARDKIFALVALSSDVDISFIDYSISDTEIQIRLARICMQSSMGLGPLTWSFVDTMCHPENLPSWTPNWMDGQSIQNNLGIFYARARNPNQPPNWSFLTLDTVQIRGIIFDKVRTIIHETPYMTPATDMHDLALLVKYFKDMEAWDDACWEMAINLKPYPTNENIFEAYWGALTFSSERSMGMPVIEQIDYEAWMSTIIVYNKVFSNVMSLPNKNSSKPAPTSIWEYIKTFFSRISTYWQVMKFWIHFRYTIQRLLPNMKHNTRYAAAFKRYSFGRKFAASENGYMGWVPWEAKEGDLLCYFEHCQLPFVIRSSDGVRYRLIGAAYLHGIMYEPPPGLDMDDLETIFLV